MSSKKKIYKNFKENLLDTLLPCGCILIIILLIYLIFAGILLVGGSSYLSSNFFGVLLCLICVSIIIWLVTPFIYGLGVFNSALNNKDENITLKSFINASIRGFKAPWSKQLQIWNNLLKSVLIYLVVELVTLLIVFALAGAGALPNISNMFSELMALDLSNSSSTVDLNNIIEKYEDSINTLSLYVNFFSLLFGTYYFYSKMSQNTLRYFVVNNFLNAPNRLITQIFKMTIKKHRKKYYGAYYSTLYPLTIIFVVSFSLSYFLIGYLGPASLDINLLSLTSIMISTVCLVTFLPLIFDFDEDYFAKFNLYFMCLLIEEATAEVETFKNNRDIYEKQDAKMEESANKFIDSMKAQYEKAKEELDAANKENLDKKDEDDDKKDKNE